MRRRWGRVRLAATLVAAFAALGLAFPPTVLAQSALKVELVPSSVTPPPGEVASVLVIVRNGDKPAQNVRLSWSNNTEATVTLRSPTNKMFKTLVAGAERAWQLDVATPGVLVPGKVFFRVDSVTAKTPHITVAPLDVQSAVPTKLEDIATVDIKTTLESLDQQHPGTVYLLVTNKSSATLTVAEVDGSETDSVEIVKPKLTEPAVPGTTAGKNAPQKPLTIAPHETKSIKVTVEAKPRVHPGKHLLLFDVHLTWGAAPHLQSAHFITTKETQIGVTGVTEALTILGVPSFLLVPGFLILIAMAILWRLRLWRPASAPQDFPLDAKSPEFWALAITLSIVTAVLYPRLGGHNYLSDYGLHDVVLIWSISLAIGAAIYVALIGGLQLRYRRRTPTRDDDQVEVLKKLGRQKLRLKRERFALTQGTTTYSGYLLQKRDGADKVWLAPLIQVAIKSTAPNGDQLLHQLRAENNPKRLAGLIEDKRSSLELSWDGQGGPEHPYEVAAADLKTEKKPDRIVRTH